METLICPVNKSHTLAYSIVGLQELNLAYKYSIVYWNCANLIIDSGSYDVNSNDSTNYEKMAVAIAKMQKENVLVSRPSINNSDFGFAPDESTSRIIFGLKAITSINTELAQLIINNRPYSSMEDFANKLLRDKEEIVVNEDGTTSIKVIKSPFTVSKMIPLIKSGCFSDIHSSDRRKTMDWYLRNFAFSPIKSLTISHLAEMKERGMIPKECKKAITMLEFKKYVLDPVGLVEKHIEEGKKVPKRGYHDGYYILDANSQNFFCKWFSEQSVVDVKSGFYVLSEKRFTKEVDAMIQPLRDWMARPETLDEFNEYRYRDLWRKYADGSEARWNMEALSFYEKGCHELEHIDEARYSIENFFEMPTDPEVYDHYFRWVNGKQKAFPKYRITCIAGTIIQVDKNHSMITLLTKHGAVDVKMPSGKFNYYNKQISELQADGSKQVLEKKWFQRGTMLRVTGFRRDDQFVLRKYSDTVFSHTINKIARVNDDGSLEMIADRIQTE